MIYSTVVTRAQTNSSLPADPCALSSDNIYANPDLDLEDKMALYHKTINDKFNAYIKLMLAAGPGTPDGLPPATPEECTESNYSTFCVGRDLLSNPTYGYMAYHKALSCSKYSFFETAKEKNAWDTYMEATSTASQSQDVQEAESNYQGARVLMISARLEAITREIESSKRALDQTLAAYNELRTAWPLHKKYMEIYKSLVTYRDKISEIRHQAEEFPSKFIDATTTKCI